MVGDTADGIEERLGAEYGDYARRAAGAIEDVANNIAAKDPDELIDDTRNFVRNAPDRPRRRSCRRLRRRPAAQERDGAVDDEDDAEEPDN